MKNTSKLAIAICGFLVSLFLPSTTLAYSLVTCPGGFTPIWENPNQTWRLNTSQFTNDALIPMEQSASRIHSVALCIGYNLYYEYISVGDENVGV